MRQKEGLIISLTFDAPPSGWEENLLVWGLGRNWLDKISLDKRSPEKGSPDKTSQDGKADKRSVCEF